MQRIRSGTKAAGLPLPRAVLGALMLTLTLAGCSSPQPGTPAESPTSGATSASSTPTGSGPTPTTSQETSMRDTLAAGLRAADSRGSAELVEQPQTTLTPLATPWLRGWRIVRVENQTPPHPRALYAALAEDGSAELLTNRPEAFRRMTSAAGVSVPDASTAGAVAATFVDTTRSFAKASYRITSLDDVTWRNKLDAEQQQRRTEVQEAYAKRLGAPRPERSGDGWGLTMWTVTGLTLVEHTLAVGADGAVQDRPVVVVPDLPVPDSR